MSPRGDLPIEPLPDAAWDRVREEVFAELQSEGAEPAPAVNPRWQPLLALAAVLGAIVMVVFLAAPRGEVALDTTTSRIATVGEHTRATVGDATLHVGVDTELVTTGNDSSGWTVLIERGQVAFAVPKREGRPHFRVVAGRARVDVVGTRFTVARAGDAVRVSVEQGKVRVTADGETQELGEGERWEIEPPREAPVEEPAQPLPAASTETPDAPTPRAEQELATEAQGRLEAPPPLASAAAGTPPSRRERYEAASRLETKRPSEAVAAYLELARGSDAWAANALYAAARLELERGRKASARSLLQQYLTRFPRGTNAQEARTLLARLP
jgi:hypothetical protein